MQDKHKFVKFLVRAKQNTYAGDGKKSAPSRPNSIDLHYSENDLLYIDSYVGSRNFIGEEVVWENGVAIWGMNYYGYMLVDDIPDGFIEHLKEALRNVDPERPYRGPEIYKNGAFEYHCNSEGFIENYHGVEKIYYNSELVYKLLFHGGAIL